MSLDRFDDAGPAFGRREVLGVFNRRHFVSNRVIFYRFARPAGVVRIVEMVGPRLIAHSLRHLNKYVPILRLQIDVPFLPVTVLRHDGQGYVGRMFCVVVDRLVGNLGVGRLSQRLSRILVAVIFRECA